MTKDMITILKGRAKQQFKNDVEFIQKHEARIRASYLLGSLFEDKLMGSSVTTHVPLTEWGSTTITINLCEEHNMERSIVPLFEEFSGCISRVSEREYKAPQIDQYHEFSNVDFKWNKLRIQVYYGNGNCERVEIGEEVVVNKKYTVICN